MLDVLGVAHCARRTPEQMSGGEQQRTAIAVALANRPRLLLADEPTGELDTATAHDVFAALRTANTELGVTILVVTHDPAVSVQVDRVIAIRDGRTSTETLQHSSADEHGNSTRQAVEYAVLDRTGRLQLPSEMTAPLGMRGLVRLQAEPDHIGVSPDRRTARRRAPRAGDAREDGPAQRPGGAAVTGREAAGSAVTRSPAAAALVVVDGVTRIFGRETAAVHALRGVSLSVGRGQLVALCGRSGSGKTTLLNIVGGLDRPDGGSVHVAGR